MSFACDFRNFAWQVKGHISGANRRRSASNHTKPDSDLDVLSTQNNLDKSRSRSSSGHRQGPAISSGHQEIPAVMHSSISFEPSHGGTRFYKFSGTEEPFRNGFEITGVFEHPTKHGSPRSISLSSRDSQEKRNDLLDGGGVEVKQVNVVGKTMVRFLHRGGEQQQLGSHGNGTIQRQGREKTKALQNQGGQAGWHEAPVVSMAQVDSANRYRYNNKASPEMSLRMTSLMVPTSSPNLPIDYTLRPVTICSKTDTRGSHRRAPDGFTEPTVLCNGAHSSNRIVTSSNTTSSGGGCGGGSGIPDITVSDGDVRSHSLGSVYPCYYFMSKQTWQLPVSRYANQSMRELNQYTTDRRAAGFKSSLTSTKPTEPSESLHRQCSAQLELHTASTQAPQTASTHCQSNANSSPTLAYKSATVCSISPKRRPVQTPQVTESTTSTTISTSTSTETEEILPALPERSSSLQTSHCGTANPPRTKHQSAAKKNAKQGKSRSDLQVTKQQNCAASSLTTTPEETLLPNGASTPGSENKTAETMTAQLSVWDYQAGGCRYQPMSIYPDQSSASECQTPEAVKKADRMNSVNHASRLLGRMSKGLRDGRLSDVVLLAGKKTKSKGVTSTEDEGVLEVDGPNESLLRIPAHRVVLAAASDYFAAMFGGDLKESTESEVWIHDVEPKALETLVTYIYTGHLDLHKENAEYLLAAASFLQMTEAYETCEQFLVQNLDATNCLGMARLANQHGCQTLREKSTKFCLENFPRLVQQNDFMRLTVGELTDLLASDRLRVPNEATVFAACLRWARRHTAAGGETCPVSKGNGTPSSLAQVLSHVRLQQLPVRLLAGVLDKDPLLQNDLSATRILVHALYKQLAPDSSSTNVGSRSTDGRDRPSHEGTTDERSMSDPTENLNSNNNGNQEENRSGKQQQSGGLSVGANRNHISLSKYLQHPRPSTIGRLLVMGGKTGNTENAVQEILEYDPYWNRWRVIGHLPGQRQQCGCLALPDGQLLIIGGRDELKALSTVESLWVYPTTNAVGGVQGSRGSESNGARTLQRGLPTAVEAIPESREQTGPPDGEQLPRYWSKAGHAQAGWQVVSNMASQRHGLGVAILEGVLYAVGGHDGWSYLNTVERWNGKTGSWSPVTPMAVQRSTVGVAVLDGLLYAVGGRDGSTCLRTVERFNPHTQRWCFIAPMLHRRGGVGVGAAAGRLFAVGGHNAPPSQAQASRTASVEMYEPRTDMWTEVARLSSPRDSIAVATLGPGLYAIGGHDGREYTDQVQVFDPLTNTWSEASPLPTGRAGVAVAAICLSTPSINCHPAYHHKHKVDPLN